MGSDVTLGPFQLFPGYFCVLESVWEGHLIVSLQVHDHYPLSLVTLTNMYFTIRYPLEEAGPPGYLILAQFVVVLAAHVPSLSCHKPQPFRLPGLLPSFEAALFINWTGWGIMTLLLNFWSVHTFLER